MKTQLTNLFLAIGLTFASFAASAQTTSASIVPKAASQQTQAVSNKAIVVEYLDVVFNKRDLAKAETYWDNDMIQHNPSMPNGLDVLRGFISSDGPSPTYEPGLAMEEGDLVMIHGRYTNWFGKNMIAVDIFRLDNGKVVEHWDVMQEEVPANKSVNGNTMFPVK